MKHAKNNKTISVEMILHLISKLTKYNLQQLLHLLNIANNYVIENFSSVVSMIIANSAQIDKHISFKLSKILSRLSIYKLDYFFDFTEIKDTKLRYVILSKTNNLINNYPREQNTVMILIDTKQIELSLNQISSEDYYKSWIVQYKNSIAIDEGGVSRDLVTTTVKQLITKKHLIKDKYTNTYTFSRYIGHNFINYLLKAALIDRITLPCTLHYSYLFIVSGMCDSKFRLNKMYTYKFLSHTLSDKVKNIMDFKKYDNMFNYPQSSYIDDTIIINEIQYSLENCTEIEIHEKNNKIHRLFNKNDINKYVSMSIRFDLWYYIYSYVGYCADVVFNFVKGMNIDYTMLFTPNLLYDLFNGIHVDIKKLNIQKSYTVTEYYTYDPYTLLTSEYRISKTLIDSCAKTNCYVDNLQLIKVTTLQYTLGSVIYDNVMKVIIKLCNEIKEFDKQLLEFWYGTSVLSLDHISPIIIVCNVNNKLMNKTPIQAMTCRFELFVPLYSFDEKLIDIEELRLYTKNDKLMFNDKNIIQILLEKRLYDSVITSFNLLRSTGDTFTIV
jgi:hypothetical protein